MSTRSTTTDGTLVYSGLGSTIADTSVTNGTSYHYAVWIQRGGRTSARPG